MNSLVKIVPNVKKFNDYLFDVKKGTKPMMISGLTDVGKIHMAYSTRFYTDKPICIVTYNELQAKRIIKDLAFFGEKVHFFPKREVISFDYLAESKDTLFKRISVLNNIVKKKNKIMVINIISHNKCRIILGFIYFTRIATTKKGHRNCKQPNKDV